MTLSELQEILGQKNVAIVHFSHHANMRKGGVFPDDMLAMINNRDAWEAKCSALLPGHKLAPVGSVGILFEPTSVSQIISVCAHDAGSDLDADGNSRSLGVPPTAASIEHSLQGLPGTYNEWILKGAAVKGIFVANQRDIWVKKVVVLDIPEEAKEHFGSDSEIAAIPIELDEVFNSFPGYPVFTMGARGLEELTSCIT